jgi:hypothetical protein
MKFKTMLASMAAICMLTACEDLFEDGSLQPDGSKPSLTVKNPTKNQTITNTQALKVHATIVDKDKIENINLSVLANGSDSVLLDFNVAPDKTVVEYDTLVSLNGVVPGTYTLKISATDKRTNLAVSEVQFTVKQGKTNL